MVKNSTIRTILIGLAAMVLFQGPTAAQNKQATRFTAALANDFLFFPAPTDHYYTNGLWLELVHPGLARNPLNGLLLQPGKGAHRLYGLGLRQDLFTPRRKDTLVLQLDDRPFASSLTLLSQAYSVRPQAGVRWTSGLELGILGRPAGGRQVQNGIHLLLPNNEAVVGWVNEIRTGLILQYALEVRKRLWTNRWSRAEVGLQGRLGTLRADLAGSGELALGLVNDPFRTLADPGLRRNLQLSLVAGFDLRGVAHDGTLTGTLFSPDPRFRGRLEPERLQLRHRIGLRAGTRTLSLDLTWHFTSPEFRGGTSHAHGSLTARFWW